MTIQLAALKQVSVSASYNKCSLFMFSLYSMTRLPHRLSAYISLYYSIYSVDTLLYPYALPIHISLIFSQVFV